MTVGRKIEQEHGIFFITFTCYRWIPLIEMTQGYDLVYKWFDVLIKKGNQVAGYVIMPNHVHCLIGLNKSNQTINTIVSNGKRFMAYDIIKRLKNLRRQDILDKLAEGITDKEKSKGQIHHVFEKSFDVKVCESSKFMEQKLEYMHMNPCSKKWSLVENPGDYRHSSMKFYETFNSESHSKLTPYTALFED